MIVRQFCARHGRTVLAHSSRTLSRAYATNLSADNPALRPSERDAKTSPQIPGHPDDPSSILDSIDRAPTSKTRYVEELLESRQKSIQNLQADINAHAAARIMSLNASDKSESVAVPEPNIEAPSTSSDTTPFQNTKEFNRFRRAVQKRRGKGSHLSQTYDPATILRSPPNADSITLPMLLANQTHLGHATSLWNPANSSYIFGIRDGIHIISLDITYAYLKRAAKVVQEIARRGGLILFIGTRKGMEDAIVNSAKLAGGYHIFHRWVPGALTNGQQILGKCDVKVVDANDRELPRYSELLSMGNHTVMRPDLVICMNPIENQVCLHECGIFNVPTIGVIDTDANPTWVTYPIPANDDSFRSIALIGGVLGNAAKEGQRLRKLEAARGSTTYNTTLLQGKLQSLEELAELDVRGRDSESSAEAS